MWFLLLSYAHLARGGQQGIGELFRLRHRLGFLLVLSLQSWIVLHHLAAIVACHEFVFNL